MAADLVVLDPATIGPRMPEVVTDLPAGAKRLMQTAEGVLATVVNGQVLLRNNQHTGALPGRLLRGRLPEQHPRAVKVDAQPTACSSRIAGPLRPGL